MSDKIRDALAAYVERDIQQHRNHGTLYEKAVAALAQQPAVAMPDGWKLVPVKPTEEMLSAMTAYDGTYYTAPFDQDDFSKDYAALLAAAPAAPVAASQEPVTCCPYCGGSSGRCDPSFPHPPTAEQPHPLEQFTDACSRLHSACNKVREKLADMEAAEQPDTVAVPRELLEELADVADASECFDPAERARHLLAGGAE